MAGEGETRFKVFTNRTRDDVFFNIQHCEMGKHLQQVAYSAHSDALTQVCFTCKCVRTSTSSAIIKRHSWGGD